MPFLSQSAKNSAKIVLKGKKALHQTNYLTRFVFFVDLIRKLKSNLRLREQKGIWYIIARKRHRCLVQNTLCIEKREEITMIDRNVILYCSFQSHSRGIKNVYREI